MLTTQISDTGSLPPGPNSKTIVSLDFVWLNGVSSGGQELSHLTLLTSMLCIGSMVSGFFGSLAITAKATGSFIGYVFLSQDAINVPFSMKTGIVSTHRFLTSKPAHPKYWLLGLAGSVSIKSTPYHPEGRGLEELTIMLMFATPFMTLPFLTV